MALHGIERVAVLLMWSLLLLDSVQGWRLITDEEAKNIQAGLHPVKLDTSKGLETHPRPPIIFDGMEEEDDYDEYNHGSDDDDDDDAEDEDDDEDDDDDDSEEIEKSFYDKGEVDADWDEKFKFLKPKLSAVSNFEASEEQYDYDYKAGDPTGFHFVCTKNAFKIYLFEKELDGVKVIGSKNVQSVEGSPKSCAYVNKEKGTLTVPFNGCFARDKKSFYSLQLLLMGGTQVRSATCFGPKSVKSGHMPHSSTTTTCLFTTTSSPTASTTASPTAQTVPTITQQPVLVNRSCSRNLNEKIPCGSYGISPEACITKGCCVDPTSHKCFFPENECTNTGDFIFTIRNDSAPVPLNLSALEIPGSNCRPFILTATFAIYKFHVTQCNTRAFDVGNSKVFVAEVRTPVSVLNLKYGAISRSNQVRFLIECRYSAPNNSLISAGYLVRTPSAAVPSAVSFYGLYGIELRIAKDATYSNFYPTYHAPLRLLLGQPVHLQLLLLSPVPNAVILVNYCIAYPRSGTKALVLIYEGCANPNDPGVFILRNVAYNIGKNERRFIVDAFQFMEQPTNEYIDEEIYFMCSSYLCFDSEKPCTVHCFDS